jgi:hypothetical protein
MIMSPTTLPAALKVSPTSYTEHSQIRLLLTLWSLGGAEAGVKKGDLMKRVVRKGEKSGDYAPMLGRLEAEGAIVITKNRLSLSAKGIELLAQGLQSPRFAFTASVSAPIANALLCWMRQQDFSQNSHDSVTPEGTAIAAVQDFKTMVLEVYDRLNRDYNCDNLVPIYQMRREMGDRVSRTEFSEGLLELQTNNVFQLIGGEMPNLTPKQSEDSIKTALGNVRYYAKRL